MDSPRITLPDPPFLRIFDIREGTGFVTWAGGPDGGRERDAEAWTTAGLSCRFVNGARMNTSVLDLDAEVDLACPSLIKEGGGLVALWARADVRSARLELR